jgi:glucose/arabinose dehydrogenase
LRLLRFFKLVFLIAFSLLVWGGVATAETLSSFSCEPRAHTPLLAYDFEPVLQGFFEPTSVTHAGDGSDRLFITEKSGLVRVVSEGKLLSEPFLDLRAAVLTEREQGLLSLAFHPNFEDNGRFFVFYSKVGKNGGLPLSVLEAYTVSVGDPNRADLGGKVLLSLPQPHLPIHKGGQLQFGPDGYLYLSLGDGDLPAEAQGLESLRGKLLRIDVDVPDEPYGIPPDNPFVGQEGARPEIWAYGFRNPWRFSFDPCTDELYVGDVGASRFEEIDMVEPGKNYGWPLMESTYCNTTLWTCLFARLTRPVFAYAHLADDPEGGNSVIGGVIYRGARFPELRGRYIFADFVSPQLWALTPRPRFGLAGQVWGRQSIGQTGERLSAFGIDEAGELHALGFARGALYRLVRVADAGVENE